MRTISQGRRVMEQLFVHRVVGGVCRFKPPPPRCAPSGVVVGDAPLEDNLNRFSGRNLRCDLRRNGNLAIRRELASEVSGHLSFLTLSIILRLCGVGSFGLGPKGALMAFGALT